MLSCTTPTDIANEPYSPLSSGGFFNFSICSVVAGLAGIPKTVIERSREILDELQRGFERESRTPQLTKKKTRDDSQLALFRDPGDELLEELRGMDPDETTPLDALKRIQEWKNRFG